MLNNVVYSKVYGKRQAILNGKWLHVYALADVQYTLMFGALDGTG